jgi:DME family drug/metabolite transporter
MPVLLVLVASVLFGTTGTAQALGLDGADPVAVGAGRTAIGGLSLGAIAAAFVLRKRSRISGLTRPDARVLVLVALGAAGVVAYQPTFFRGVEANGVAVGTLVALGSAPVCTGVLSWALSRRFPGRRWLVATAGAIVGVALLSGVIGGGGADTLAPAGLLASLGAGVAYASYTLATKGLLDRGWAPLSAVGAVFGVAGVVGGIQLLTLSSAWPDSGGGVAALVWLGLAATTLAYVVFALGLAALPAATVATLTLAEPLVATLLGVAVLGERLSLTAVVGIGVLVAALSLLAAPAGPAAASRRLRRKAPAGAAA